MCSDEKGRDGYVGKKGCLSCVGPRAPGPVLCLSSNDSPVPIAPVTSTNRLPLTIGLSVTAMILLLAALAIVLWKLASAKKLNRSQYASMSSSSAELLAGASGNNQSTMFDFVSISIN